MDRNTVIVVGVICITVLEIFNIVYMKMDGFIFGAVLTSIGTIIGYLKGGEKKSGRKK